MIYFDYSLLKKLIIREKWQDHAVDLQEVEAMERQLGICFPDAVKEMMRLLGKDWDDLIRNGGGKLQCLPNLPFIQDVAQKVLKMANQELPFSFLAITEYHDQFIFVRLDEGEDPPVYGFYMEDIIGQHPDPKSPYPMGMDLIAHSFSSMVEAMAQERLDLLDSLGM